MKRIVLGIVSALALAAAATAGPYEEAIEALDQGDLDTSLKLLRQAGGAGNVPAQTLLGGMYNSGYLQIRRNLAESVKWYRMAANRSDRAAQFRMGLAHENGTGATRDPVRAFMWYELAASGNHEQSRRNRDRLAGGLSGEQIAEARRLARDWKPEDR